MWQWFCVRNQVFEHSLSGNVRNVDHRVCSHTLSVTALGDCYWNRLRGSVCKCVRSKWKGRDHVGRRDENQAKNKLSLCICMSFVVQGVCMFAWYIPDRLDVEIRALGANTITSRTPCLSLCWRWLLMILALCLGSLFCCRISLGPVRHLLKGIACWISICLYFSALTTPLILTKSPMHSLLYHSPALPWTTCTLL